MKLGTCLFCGLTISITENHEEEVLQCHCENCGVYRINEDTLNDLPNERVYKKNKDKNYLLSGYFREMTELGLTSEVISVDRYESIFSNAKIPKSLLDKIEKFLLHIYRKTSYLGEEVEIDFAYPAVAYAKNLDELKGIIKTLVSMGYIETEFYEVLGTNYATGANNILTNVSLLAEGISKAELLQKNVINSNQCFVAMQFSDEMINNFYSYIQPIIKEKTGYYAFIVAMKEHNGKICDEIIAEIRKSKFLIADFTGHRGGVYFEAGFAYGLGLTVIWTCREDDLDKLHFDIRQYNFIVWKTPEELCERLANRILATISSR